MMILLVELNIIAGRAFVRRRVGSGEGAADGATRATGEGPPRCPGPAQCAATPPRYGQERGNHHQSSKCLAGLKFRRYKSDYGDIKKPLVVRGGRTIYNCWNGRICDAHLSFSSGIRV